MNNKLENTYAIPRDKFQASPTTPEPVPQTVFNSLLNELHILVCDIIHIDERLALLEQFLIGAAPDNQEKNSPMVANNIPVTARIERELHLLLTYRNRINCRLDRLFGN